MAWIKTNESKGIFFSLLMHSIILGVVLLSDDKLIKQADKEKMVSIDLVSYQPPKPKVIEKQEPKPEPKKVEKPKPKPKPIKTKEPKHKPIVHKKQEPKPEPIKEPEPIKKEVKEIVKDIVKPESTQPNKQAQKQAFIKTNFAIIRDMVLSNLIYPNIAKRMGWTGVVEVKLTIDSKGKLLSYFIHKSSGKKHLDDAALNAVKAIISENLPKPKNTTTLILPISFQLR